MAKTKSERMKLSRDLEKIAKGIEEMARIGTSIQESRLEFDAIVLLVSKSSNVRFSTVESVLESLSGLNSKYLKDES